MVTTSLPPWAPSKFSNGESGSQLFAEVFLCTKYLRGYRGAWGVSKVRCSLTSPELMHLEWKLIFKGEHFADLTWHSLALDLFLDLLLGMACTSSAYAQMYTWKSGSSFENLACQSTSSRLLCAGTVLCFLHTLSFFSGTTNCTVKYTPLPFPFHHKKWKLGNVTWFSKVKHFLSVR